MQGAFGEDIVKDKAGQGIWIPAHKASPSDLGAWACSAKPWYHIARKHRLTAQLSILNYPQHSHEARGGIMLHAVHGTDPF